MVILGGLEIVAAGYLIHKHNKNKRERARLEEDAAALEESQYPLQEATRPHHKHSHSHSRPHSHSHSYSDDDDEARRERRRRRRSRERREQEKYEGRPPRQNSAPPRPLPTQMNAEPGIVTGWPAHWKQSQTPPVAVPPQAQNQYPPDVKYGFVPEIPHEPYQPPPYSAAPVAQHRQGERRDRDRADTLEVRGRHERRSVSPRLGSYDEYSRSPGPRVRFSTEDVILGERLPKYKP